MPETKAPRLVLGCMGFARPGANGPGVRIFDTKVMADELAVFKKHGHVELDSVRRAPSLETLTQLARARMYGGFTNESLLKDLGWKEKGFQVDTKIWPFPPHSLRPDDIVKQIKLSLTELGVDKLGLVYLHSPDRQTPIEDTLSKLDELYKQGLFESLGLSGYTSWEIARICEACTQHQWIKPSVVQAPYSAFARSVEPELIPCLRQYGIKLYAYGVTLSGILTKKDINEEVEKGSRFDTSTVVGPMVRAMVWNQQIFDAGALVRAACDSAAISPVAASYRWIAYHSQLKAELGDSVLVSGSSAEQLQDNLEALEAGPLPAEVVEAFEAGWKIVKGVAIPYHR